MPLLIEPLTVILPVVVNEIEPLFVDALVMSRVPASLIVIAAPAVVVVAETLVTAVLVRVMNAVEFAVSTPPVTRPAPVIWPPVEVSVTLPVPALTGPVTVNVPAVEREMSAFAFVTLVTVKPSVSLIEMAPPTVFEAVRLAMASVPAAPRPIPFAAVRVSAPAVMVPLVRVIAAPVAVSDMALPPLVTAPLRSRAPPVVVIVTDPPAVVFEMAPRLRPPALSLMVTAPTPVLLTARLLMERLPTVPNTTPVDEVVLSAPAVMEAAAAAWLMFVPALRFKVPVVEIVPVVWLIEPPVAAKVIVFAPPLTAPATVRLFAAVTEIEPPAVVLLTEVIDRSTVSLIDTAPAPVLFTVRLVRFRFADPPSVTPVAEVVLSAVAVMEPAAAWEMFELAERLSVPVTEIEPPDWLMLPPVAFRVAVEPVIAPAVWLMAPVVAVKVTVSPVAVTFPLTVSVPVVAIVTLPTPAALFATPAAPIVRPPAESVMLTSPEVEFVPVTVPIVRVPPKVVPVDEAKVKVVAVTVPPV